MDYTVRRNQESGHSKTKSRAGRLKAIARAEENFIRVTSLRDRRLTAPNITSQLNKRNKKNLSTSTVKRRLFEAGLYD